MNAAEIVNVLLIAYAITAVVLLLTYKILDKKVRGSKFELVFVTLFTGLMLYATVVYFINRGISFIAIFCSIAVIAGLNMIRKSASRNTFIITINQLETKMKEAKLDDAFTEELLKLFNKKIGELGEQGFTSWLTNLHYSVPDEFEKEHKAIQLYEKCCSWIEAEIIKLELETMLTWEELTIDMNHMDEKARKAQLVIRQKVTNLVLDFVE